MYSLARKYLLLIAAPLLALTAIAVTTESASALTGSRLNSFGGSSHASAALRQFSGELECSVGTDGSLLVAQTFPNGDPNVSKRSGIRVARLSTSGRLVRSFGDNGTVRISSFFNPGNPTVDSRRRILIAGGRKVDGVERLHIARLTASGKLDRRFGTGGFFRVAIKTPTIGRDAIVTPLADGRTAIAVSPAKRAPLRIVQVIDASGKLDRSFAAAGTLETAFTIHGVASADRSRILLTGGPPPKAPSLSSVQAVMYSGDGSVDASWGTLGAVSWSAFPASVEDKVQESFLARMEPHPDRYTLSSTYFSSGKAQLVAGSRMVVAITSSTFAKEEEFSMYLVWSTRLTSHGQLDLTYGRSGASFDYDITNGSSWMDEGDFESYDWELLRDGRIGVWHGLYGYTDELDGVLLPANGGDRGSKNFNLKFLIPRDVAFDPDRNRALLCATYKKRSAVFSLRL